MGFLHSRLKIWRLHNCLIWSWGCVEHQASEGSWEERAKHWAWSWGEGPKEWIIIFNLKKKKKKKKEFMTNLVLGCKNTCYSFSSSKCSSVFLQHCGLQLYILSVGSHWMALESMSLVQKNRLHEEAVTRSLHKAKVKTRNETEDLKTSRCTYWRGGPAGEQATAEHWKHVSHIRCAVKKNTAETPWGHEYPETGLAADFTHDLCPWEFPFNSLCETSGLFAFLDKYGPTSCTCSPDNTLQRSIFLKCLIVFKKEIADG